MSGNTVSGGDKIAFVLGLVFLFCILWTSAEHFKGEEPTAHQEKSAHG